MKLILDQTFSNRQYLLFKIINIIDKFYYDIQFEVDNLILKNQPIRLILEGKVFHPDNLKYHINNRVTKFYHDCEEKALLCSITFNNKFFNKNLNCQTLYTIKNNMVYIKK